MMERRLRDGGPKALAAGLVAVLVGCAGSGSGHGSAARPPTFTRDVAPILYEHCVGCHRPGGAGPFSLLTYDGARSHARQMAAVTANRYMPPWLPDPGDPGFVGERRLGQEEIATIRQWVTAGAVEGDPRDLPPPPRWTVGWQLGEPDLVVEMDEAYTVAAEGRDVFRNFVIPIPVSSTRYVRAVEFDPGNPRVVHHAVLAIDRTRASRRLDAGDPGPGFGGMDMGYAEQPEGHFLGWTPGKAPRPVDERMAWRLSPGTDLVVQLHLVASGKLEAVRSQVAFHFARAPATLRPSVVMLSNNEIDIPPGATDYAIEDALVLPVPVDVLGIYPHAHYLGKEMLGLATLPDGTRRTLIHIRNWDFNWQDDYRYAEPVGLPAGTTLSMRYTYDNSEANERNPNHPPRRVVHGPQSSDEMGALLLQVLARTDEEQARLAEARARHNLRKYPNEARRHNDLGIALQAQGRLVEAAEQYRRALALDPTLADLHYNLGLALSELGRSEEAVPLYLEAIRLNPDHAKAHNNLGNIYRAAGRIDEARERFLDAVRLQPDLAIAHFNLGVVETSRGHHAEAIAHYRQAIELDPGHAMAHNNLGSVLHLERRLDEAIACYREALRVDPGLAEAHNNLGYAFAAQGRLGEAVREYREALRLAPAFALAHNNLGLALRAQGDLAQAVDHFREALRIDAGYAEARENLDATLEKLGQARP